jgi:hypothetical protein
MRTQSKICRSNGIDLPHPFLHVFHDVFTLVLGLLRVTVFKSSVFKINVFKINVSKSNVFKCMFFNGYACLGCASNVCPVTPWLSLPIKYRYKGMMFSGNGLVVGFSAG